MCADRRLAPGARLRRSDPAAGNSVGEFAASLPAWRRGMANLGTGGLARRAGGLRAVLSAPERPRFIEAVETQRRLRETPPPWPRSDARRGAEPLDAPRSLRGGIFDNAMELGTLDDTGAFPPSLDHRNGLADARPTVLTTSGDTPRLDSCRPLAPAGARLAVRSIHLGEPFTPSST